VDDGARSVLAAVAAIQDDDDAEANPTAEAIAERSGLAAPVVKGALHRLLREGLVMHVVRGYFVAAGAPPAAPDAFTITKPGRARLADAG